jgi:polyhydroxyalkanoate synthesis repressor PhaR
MQRIVKRYRNRKLYDTENKKYVVLSEIEAMIIEGVDVQVMDVESGQDVSGQVMTQIILRRKEDARKVPLEGLKTWISQGSDSMKKAFQKTYEFGKGVKDKVEKDLTQIFQKREGDTEAGSKGMDLDSISRQFEKAGAWITDLVDERLRRGLLRLPTHKDLGQLQIKLEELEKKLERLIPSKKEDK